MQIGKQVINKKAVLSMNYFVYRIKRKSKADSNAKLIFINSPFDALGFIE